MAENYFNQTRNSQANLAGGLKALMNSFIGRRNEQQQLQNQKFNAETNRQTAGYSDPTRPITERDVMGAALKDFSTQAQMAPFTGKMPDFKSIIQTYMQAFNQSGAVSPQPAPQPVTTPTKINRGGFKIPTMDQIQQARQKGAVGFDDDLGQFVDANGNPVQ